MLGGALLSRLLVPVLFLATPGVPACAAAQPRSGMASSPPAKAVYDPQHRPITAAVFF
ncbi:MAG: hypothetical protein ACYCPO_04445 [Acidobacteriaceae bacterium]